MSKVHVLRGWVYLAAKYLYYCKPEHANPLSDSEFDRLEQLIPAEEHYVDFPSQRPAALLIAEAGPTRAFNFIEKHKTAVLSS